MSKVKYPKRGRRKSDVDPTREFNISGAMRFVTRGLAKSKPNNPNGEVLPKEGRKSYVEGEPAEPLAIVVLYGPFEARKMQSLAEQFYLRGPDHIVLQYAWDNGILDNVKQDILHKGYHAPDIILVSDDMHMFPGSVSQNLEELVASTKQFFPWSFHVGIHSDKPISSQAEYTFGGDKMHYVLKAPVGPTEISNILVAFGQSDLYAPERRVYHAGNVGLVPVRKSEL